MIPFEGQIILAGLLGLCFITGYIITLWTHKKRGKDMKIIKVPICQFGKDLKIEEIIEHVRYVKGNHNDIGDSHDDYVEIVIR